MGRQGSREPTDTNGAEIQGHRPPVRSGGNKTKFANRRVWSLSNFLFKRMWQLVKQLSRSESNFHQWFEHPMKSLDMLGRC